jgi:hypothetical protein
LPSTASSSDVVRMAWAKVVPLISCSPCCCMLRPRFVVADPGSLSATDVSVLPLLASYVAILRKSRRPPHTSHRNGATQKSCRNKSVRIL